MGFAFYRQGHGLSCFFWKPVQKWQTMGQRLKFGTVMEVLFWASWNACVFASANASAGEQDTLRTKPLELTEVSVRTFRWNRPTDSVWHKTMPMASLAEVMGMQGAWVTRQASPGGLSTLAYRGGGAAHNDLYWGDFSLNHPMNRTTDLQLVPVWLFQGLAIDNGGDALQTGGYGMGGGLGLGLLNGPRLEAVASAGTLADKALGWGWTTGKAKWRSQTRGLITRNANRYTYPNRALPSSPETTMQGADFGQEAIVNQTQFQGRSGHSFESGCWLQGSRRGIPNSMTARPGSARQNDSLARFQGKWSWQQNRRLLWWSSGALQRDLNRYTDTLNGIYGLHQTTSYQARGGLHYHRRGWALRPVVLWDRYQAKSSQYASPLVQERWAMILPWALDRGHFEFSGQVKAEVLDGHLLPAAAFLRARWLRNKAFWWLEARTSVNPPSLNDRYWVPGGRPDLRPERGRQLEGGARLFGFRQRSKMDVTMLAFWRDMRERILWQPTPNSAFWSPTNVGVSPALGSEIRAQGWGSSAAVDDLAWTWQLDYSLQRVWSALEPGTRTQWPYVPVHRWAAQGSLQRGSWSVMGQVQGVSARNTLTDGSETLPAYALVTFAGSYERNGQRLSLQIRNLTQTHYEEVPWFPRPGRSFHLALYTSIPSTRSPKF